MRPAAVSFTTVAVVESISIFSTALCIDYFILQKADLGLSEKLFMREDLMPEFDYSTPFQVQTGAGLTAVYKGLEDDDESSSLNLFSPFPWPVWTALAVAYVLASLLLFVVARISPYERRAENRDSSSALCDIGNVFWFTLTGLLLKNSSFSPKVIYTSLNRAIECVSYYPASY